MAFMNKAPLWGGIAFMLGSLLFLVNKFNEMSRLWLGNFMADVIDGNDIAVIAVGQVAYIVGYVIYFRHFAPRAGKATRIALGLFCGGGVILAIGHVSFTPVLPFDAFLLVGIGLLLALIGLIWFGIAALRQPILTRWRWLPLFTGVMGTIGFIVFSGPEINAIFLVFRTLFALGLFGLGLNLALEKQRTSAAPSAAPGAA